MFKTARVFTIAAIFTVLICFNALANTWTPINDELDIDYKESIIQIFIIGFKKHDNTKALNDAAVRTYAYICSLPYGKGGGRLGAELKKRPALDAKVKSIISREVSARPNVKHDYPDWTKIEDGTLTAYLYFPLKKLLSVLPDLQIPEKE